MDESKMAGFGTYFAQDPLQSRSYGRYLVAVAIPLRKTIGHFNDKIQYDFKSILAHHVRHHGIVPAFAARDVRVFAPDGGKDLSGIKIWSLDAESIPQREMWKIDPYRGNFNLKSFISHFADWIDFISPHLPLLREGKVTIQLKVKTLIYVAGKRAAQEEGMKEWGYWDFNAMFDYTNKLPVPEARWNTLLQFLVQKDYLPQSARKLTPNNKRQLYNLAVKQFKDNRGGPTLHSFVKILKTLLDMPKLGDWKQVL